MGDAGEVLVDAEDRLQERLAEREQERERRSSTPPSNPVRQQRLTSLELARAELRNQAGVTQNPLRRKQIEQALADLSRRIAEV
ncbi:MAG TPA: hypothetical protein VI669_12850 [Vicinamibacteria bacterium]